jgi:hypothetical protein
MKKEIPTQLVVGLSILLIGGAFLGVEYVWVRLAPVHKRHVADEALKLLPYHNDALGIDMQVAAGFYGKVENFPGGAKILKPRFFGVAPSITITSEPNVDHASEFSPQALAIWETDGVTRNIPRYHFDPTKINNRDAVLIRKLTTQGMALIAHVISPDHIIVAVCLTGSGDEALLLEACEGSLRTIKITGPEPQTPPALEEVSSPKASSQK